MAMGAERGGPGGSDVGRGSSASGGYGDGGGGGGLSALGAAVRAAQTATGMAPRGGGLAATMAVPGMPQMDAATRQRISNIQRNATHQFQGQMDDANNVGDPMGSIGAGLAGMVGLSEHAPAPGDTFDGGSYDTDPRASWGFDPIRAGASLVGAATGVPGLGYLGGMFSDQIGNPGSVSLGKDVFGPSTSSMVKSAPNETGAPDPSAPPAGPDRNQLGMRALGARLMGLADGGMPSLYMRGQPRGGREGGGGPSYQPLGNDQIFALLQQFGLNPTMPQVQKPANLWQAAANGGTLTQRGVTADILRRAGPVTSGGDGHFLQGPGDGRSDSIDARVADGEYIVPADVVSAIGNGSSAAGARAIDSMVGKTRKTYRSHLGSLPQPKK